MDWFGIVGTILLCCIVIFALVCGFIGIIEEDAAKVEAVVVSCEEGREVENAGMKAMAITSFAQGKTLNAINYNNLAKIGSQKYNVVVEYEGVQYEIEMDHMCEVGEIIKVTLPTN